MCTFPRCLLTLPLVTFMALTHIARGADLPEKLQDEIVRAKSRLEQEFKSAEESLVSAFDKQIANTRSAPKLRPEEKQRLIATREAEKAIFETKGYISFCPAMRTETIEFLNRIQKAATSLAKAYDRAIEYHTKSKNDNDARALVVEKKQALARTVGIWKVGKSKWILLSNGTVLWKDDGNVQWPDSAHSWTLDQRQLVFRWRTGLKDVTDTCVIAVDGMQFDGTNQDGVKFAGKRETTE